MKVSLSLVSPLNVCAILQNILFTEVSITLRTITICLCLPQISLSTSGVGTKPCSVSFYWPLCQNAYPTNVQREVEDDQHVVPSQLVLLDLP